MAISQQAYELINKAVNPSEAPAEPTDIPDDASLEQFLEAKNMRPSCPRCGERSRIGKHGKKAGHQRFRCLKCGKTWGWSSNTPYYRSRMPYGVWKEFVRCVETRTPLREAAERCGISLHTACKWRQRYLEVHANLLVEIAEEMVAKGLVRNEVDVTSLHRQLRTELDRIYRGRSKLVAKKRFLNWQLRWLEKVRKKNGGW